MRAAITTLTLMAFGVSSMACGGSEPEPEPVAVATTGDEAPPPEPEEEEPAGEMEEDPSDVHIEDDHVTIDQQILFVTGSDEISEESSEILQHLATFLYNHPGDIPGLQVIGHTDAVGGDRPNQELSQRRAIAVVSALRDLGVDQPMEAIGRGRSQRLCQEDTDECHERNRRVEFIILTPDDLGPAEGEEEAEEEG